MFHENEYLKEQLEKTVNEDDNKPSPETPVSIFIMLYMFFTIDNCLIYILRFELRRKPMFTIE